MRPEDADDPALIGDWAWFRRVGWRPLALGALAVMAYQFALHFHMYWQLPHGERMRGSMPFIPAMMGAPFAFSWAVLVVMWARHLCGSWKIPGHMLRGGAGWALLVVLVSTVYVAERDSWESACSWIFIVPIFTVLGGGMGLVMSGPAWKVLHMLAIGVPSVAPMFLLVWWARRRTPATA